MSAEPLGIVIARDIAIILLCLGGMVATIILILIGWKVYQILSLVKNKTEEFSILGRALVESARETAEKAGETATTVKGSAEFISDTVVNPVVQVVSAVSGAKSFVAAFFRSTNTSRDGGRT